MGKNLDVGLTWLVAVLIIAAWLGVLWEMWWRVDTATDAAWTRMVAIMTALQAVAFAAAGALFGVKLQSVETDKAKEGEKKAEEGREKAIDVAKDGKKLAEMLDEALAQGTGNLNFAEDDLSSLRRQARIVRDARLS